MFVHELHAEYGVSSPLWGLRNKGAIMKREKEEEAGGTDSIPFSADIY